MRNFKKFKAMHKFVGVLDKYDEVLGERFS